MLFDSSKRKNEDKPKRRPCRLVLLATVAALLIIAGVGFFLMTPGYVPMSDVPTDKVVYVQDAELYAVDFETGERALTSFIGDPDAINSKKTSPDGRWQIRFELVVPHQYTNSYLVLEDLTGQEPLRSLGTFYGTDSTLSWSPDQEWVAFTAYDPNLDTSQGGHAAEIWMIHLPTTEATRLSTNTYLDSDPFFSPDGTQLAYMSAVDGYPRVYIMDVATRESRLLTPHQYGDNPKWSPDGQWVAFDAFYGVDENNTYTNYMNVYVVRVDGAHTQAITFGNTGHGRLIGWQS